MEPEEEDKKKLLGSRFLDAIEGKVAEVGSSIMGAAQEDDTTWTDDAIRLGLGGAKNVGNVLNAPGIRHALQGLGAPAWIVGKGLGWTLEKGGVDPRYGQIVGEVGEWFIPFYGAGKLVTKARGLGKTVKTLDQFKDATKGTSIGYKKRMNITGEYTSRSDLGREIVNQLNYSPPSSTLDELDLLKNQPFFQQASKLEQDRLIGDFPVLTQDMLNPNLSTKFRQQLGATALNVRTGRKLLDNTDVIRYSEFRGQSRYMADQGRPYLASYMTIDASDLDTFGRFKNTQLPRLRQEYSDLISIHPILANNRRIAVQVHHIAALKATFGIYDGVQKGSRLYNDINAQLLKHIKGLGDASENLVGVIGGSRVANTPHGIVHSFYREIIGEAGEKFFTPEVLTRMRYDRTFRLQKADELGRIIKESETLVRDAQALIAKRGRSDINLQDVIERISKKDFEEMIELRKQPKTDVLIENAIQKEAVDWFNKTDPYALKDQNLDKLRDAEKYINKEISLAFKRSDNLPDTVSTEHLEGLERYLERLKESRLEIENAIKKLTYDK